MPPFSFLSVFIGFLSIWSTASGAKSPRVFSESYIEGVYGRFFEFSDRGNSAPCPQVIDHFNRGEPSALGDSWIIPHGNIVQSGAKCRDGGVLVLNSYNESSAMPKALESNQIAEETFTLMKEESTGFWMGADDRKCGKWLFPKRTYVFFVKEFDRNLTTSFRLTLSAGKKYMFVVSDYFTCIYVDIPRSRPGSDVVITPSGENVKPSDASKPSPGGGNGSNEGDNTVVSSGGPGGSGSSGSGKPSSEDGSPNENPPTPTPTPITETSDSDGDSESDGQSGEGDNVSGGDATGDGDNDSSNGVSIIDVDNGQAPQESGNPSSDSIIAIDSDASSGNNEDDAQATDESFDVETSTGESLCFPSDATVEMIDGSSKRMDELVIGDEIRVGDQFSPVFLFTHNQKETLRSFVQIETESHRKLALTAGHMLYANGILKAAMHVKTDDHLRVVDGTDRVVRVSKVVKKGLFNPQTMHGDIVVNGLVTSTYTTAVDAYMAHTVLAPLRAMWNLVGFTMIPNTVNWSEIRGRLIRVFNTVLVSKL
ncbi:Desert hedgehog protein A [Gracilariopsis chorda]|uniref:Desert hedgehog protein A n=1 Tax=Gracilariopsis chorda TaxID=448386 RepID=A0A2V3IFE9_9FLOR|nr:Desert hedgehog protein A [Gracilariopsis chorda]|eukprot:PXF40816.1 Desert hedgehog protein A [Gracilariopsis chorda]